MSKTSELQYAIKQTILIDGEDNQVKENDHDCNLDQHKDDGDNPEWWQTSKKIKRCKEKGTSEKVRTDRTDFVQTESSLPCNSGRTICDDEGMGLQLEQVCKAKDECSKAPDDG